MNYILGINLNLEQLGFVNLKKVYHIPDPKTAMGWSKKILDFIINTIENSSSQELSKLLDITYRKAKTLKENKEVIIKKMYHYNIFSNDFKLSDKFWLNFINKAIDSKSLKIDPQSSSDIYKIMRVPDTIHGGTGFLSTTIKDIDALKKFDAFSDPVIFDSENKIKIKIIKPTPKFRIFKEYYGPYTFNDIVEVKEGIAIFLVLKGVADFER
jgi:DNA primase small subunit